MENVNLPVLKEKCMQHTTWKNIINTKSKDLEIKPFTTAS
jgi:hypothetical protein